ncbi:MAG: hypothetical protein ACFFGZ_07960 [Candidatus Thorarchaeota archaeon]
MEVADSEKDKVTQILGLTEEQARVYFAALNLRYGTLGEISQLSGVNIMETARNLEILESQNLVRRIEGKIISRFMPFLPWLRTFYLTYDPITLVSVGKQFQESFRHATDGVSTVLGSIRKDVPELLSNIQESFEALFEELHRDISELLTIISEASESLPNNEKTELKELADALDSRFQEISEEWLAKIDKLGTETNPEIGQKIETAEKEARDLFIRFTSDVNNALSAITFSVKEMKNNLKMVMDAVEESQKAPYTLKTDTVVGESAILLLMRDIIKRTRSSLQVVMPEPELQSIMLASKLPPKVRSVLVGDFSRMPAKMRQKVLESSTKIRQIDGIGFWGVLRDQEEILIAPVVEPGKDFVGIASEDDAMIRMFSEQMSSIVIRSKELKE